jgi:hypothetical protein
MTSAAAVYVGDAIVSVAVAGRDSEQRNRYAWKIALPGGTLGESGANDVVRSGVLAPADPAQALTSLLGFLSACAESRAYGARTGHPGENADLFSEQVGAWAEGNSDEISLVLAELEADD